MREELEKHLKTLQRNGDINPWHFRRITAGKVWKGEIDAHLTNARIILLQVSSDFVDSDYCYDVEMQKAMKLHEAGSARVIPVILRPVLWKSTPFGKLEALPKDGTAVTKWLNQDEAFLNITEGIQKVCAELKLGVSQNKVSSVIITEPSAPTLEKFCSRCGVKAGRKSECTTLGGAHSFRT